MNLAQQRDIDIVEVEYECSMFEKFVGEMRHGSTWKGVVGNEGQVVQEDQSSSAGCSGVGLVGLGGVTVAGGEFVGCVVVVVSMAYSIA